MTTGGFDPRDPREPSAGYPPPPNPYAPSYAPSYPTPYPTPGGYPAPAPGWGPPASGRPGGLGVRWGARVIDGILVTAVSYVLALFFDASSRILVTGLFTGLLMFVYFVVMETAQGRTFGKMLLGLHVRGPGGAAKPDLKQSAIRNAFTLLPIIPFGIGGFLAFVAMFVIAVTINSSPTKQGKHDELAGGTQVVKG